MELRLLGIFLFCAPCALFAEVPHTFKAGASAKASEVNANFKALDDKQTSLEGKIKEADTVVLSSLRKELEVHAKTASDSTKKQIKQGDEKTLELLRAELATSVERIAAQDEKIGALNKQLIRMPYLSWLFDKTKYYPNWRYDPEFFVEAPKTSKVWSVRIRDGLTRSTSSGAAINLGARYDNSSGVQQNAWYGIYVDAALDRTLFIADDSEFNYLGDLYDFRTLHSYGPPLVSMGRKQAAVTYSADDSITALIRLDEKGRKHPIPWNKVAPKGRVLKAQAALASFLDFGSEMIKECEEINLHMNADYDILVTGSCKTYPRWQD